MKYNILFGLALAGLIFGMLSCMLGKSVFDFNDTQIVYISIFGFIWFNVFVALNGIGMKSNVVEYD